MATRTKKIPIVPRVVAQPRRRPSRTAPRRVKGVKVMRLATCTCGEHGSVNVSGEGYGRTFTRGTVVDLDEKVTPDRKETWRDAIGEVYAHLFDESVAARDRSARRDRPADVAEAVAVRGIRSSESEAE